MECPLCGNDVPWDQHSCPHCGTTFDAVSEATPAPAARSPSPASPALTFRPPPPQPQQWPWPAMPPAQPLAPGAPLTTRPPGPPMTHKRALAFVAGVLTLFCSVYVILAGLAFVLGGIGEMLFSSGGPDGPGGLLATGIYGLVGASFGLKGGVSMVRARNYKLSLTGAILLCSSGLLPFVLGLDEEFYFPAAYLLALMVPAVALVFVASGDLVEVEPKQRRRGSAWEAQPWPTDPRGVVWPPPPGTTEPIPPPGTYRAVPPPPPSPPPYFHPNPPRPLYVKDVGQARADKAGACMTLSAAFLVFFGMMGVLWPSAMPGFVIGIASLLGAIMALVGAYLALRRVRKLLAWVMAFYAALAYAMLTISAMDADGIVGLILFLPLHTLLALALVMMNRAYQLNPPPFGAPVPAAQMPPEWRP